MRGQGADAGEGNECARAFCERGFGNVRSGGSGAGVLASRHASMVAKRGGPQFTVANLPEIFSLFPTVQSNPRGHICR
jgi:hypothetical protein